MRVFSFGGGVQSTAVLVLAAQDRLQYDAFVFANVGEDSENPATLTYLEQHAKPFAERHGLAITEIRWRRDAGKPDTLLKEVQSNTRSCAIPLYLPNGAPGNRECTRNWKIRVVARWVRERGASRLNPATVGLGISVDELQRARTDSGIAWEVLEYPLLDLRMTRAQCALVIDQAGLPQPPRSSCWFCPFHRLSYWHHLRREQPGQFRRAAELEQLLNERRLRLGRDAAYLTGRLCPLDEAFADDGQLSFDEALEDVCESGYCMV